MVAGESQRAGASTRPAADVEGDARPEGRKARARARNRRGGPNLAPGLTRLAYAWTHASTELLVGTVEVAGKLLRNLTDDFYDERPFADPSVDDEDAVPPRRMRSGRRSIARLSNALADNLVDALEDSADVLARTADRLADSYDRTGRRDDVSDAAARRIDAEGAEAEAAARRRRAAADERDAQRAKRDAADDEARARQKASTAGERPDTA